MHTFVVMKETDLAALDRDALIGLVRKLVAEVESLRSEVETLKRSGKRQAAPFSKGTRVKGPKTPGRKPGQGMFKRREAPTPESLSEPPIGVPVAETACPKCGDGMAQINGLLTIRRESWGRSSHNVSPGVRTTHNTP